MTAVFRNLTGTPMIHGTGGGRYEQVTNQWAREFLEIELPPIRVRTGDLLLPLDPFVDPSPPNTPAADGDLPERRGVRNRLRSLEHDPWDAPEIKHEWLQRIEQAPPDSALRRNLFREMHEAMRLGREVIADQLKELRALEVEHEQQDRRMELARSRTWAWPLHEAESLGSFVAMIS